MLPIPLDDKKKVFVIKVNKKFHSTLCFIDSKFGTSAGVVINTKRQLNRIIEVCRRLKKFIAAVFMRSLRASPHVCWWRPGNLIWYLLRNTSSRTTRIAGRRDGCPFARLFRGSGMCGRWRTLWCIFATHSRSASAGSDPWWWAARCHRRSRWFPTQQARNRVNAWVVYKRVA